MTTAAAAPPLARAIVDRYRERLERAEIDPDRLEAAIVEAISAAVTAHTATIREALEASVRLQAHYAGLLNSHDGGRRIAFVNGDAWIARLRETRVIAGDQT